jgi:hypothetical protein
LILKLVRKVSREYPHPARLVRIKQRKVRIRATEALHDFRSEIERPSGSECDDPRVGGIPAGLLWVAETNHEAARSLGYEMFELGLVLENQGSLFVEDGCSTFWDPCLLT